MAPKKGRYTAAVYRFSDAAKPVLDKLVAVKDPQIVSQLFSPALRVDDTHNVYKNWRSFLDEVEESFALHSATLHVPPTTILAPIEGTCIAIHYIDGAYYMVLWLELAADETKEVDTIETEHSMDKEDSIYSVYSTTNDLFRRTAVAMVSCILAVLGLHPSPSRLVTSKTAPGRIPDALADDLLIIEHEPLANRSSQHSTVWAYKDTKVAPILPGSPLTGFFVVPAHEVPSFTISPHHDPALAAFRPLTHTEQVRVLNRVHYVEAQAGARHSGAFAGAWIHDVTGNQMATYTDEQGRYRDCDTLRMAVVVGRKEAIDFFASA